MTRRGMGMTEGQGERAERSRSLRFWGIMAGFTLLGSIGGAAMIVMERSGGAMSTALAIGMVALGTVGVGAGAWWFLRDIDEVERRDNYVSCTIALNFYLILYVDWYFLWKGAVVREPDHEILFIATMIVMAGVYFWKKIRP